MKRTGLFLLLWFSCAQAFTTEARVQTTTPPPFDVLHYEAQVEPDIANKSVAGKVLIRLISRVDNLATIDLDCGDLSIDAVRENGASREFLRGDDHLRITLSRPAKAGEKREIEVEYHGTPRYGIRFFPDRAQVYTVFSTSQWLVCVDAPDDRATLRLKLIVPGDFKTVANGSLAAQRKLSDNKIVFEWRQSIPVPTYTFGFAAGRFRAHMEKRGRVQLRYLAAQFSAS